MAKKNRVRDDDERFPVLSKSQQGFYIELRKLELRGKERVILFASLKYLYIMSGVVLSVWLLAGKDTKAIIDLAIGLKNVFDISDFMPYIVLFFAGIWIAIERRLRKQTTKDMGERIKHLESILDADRSSSQLNKFGELDERKVR